MISSTRDRLLATDKPGTFSESDADSVIQTPVTVSFPDARNGGYHDDTYQGPEGKTDTNGIQSTIFRRLELLEERMERLLTKRLEKSLLYVGTLETTFAK
jgi:hypothetical protein